jgi:hypothetical protein
MFSNRKFVGEMFYWFFVRRFKRVNISNNTMFNKLGTGWWDNA